MAGITRRQFGKGIAAGAGAVLSKPGSARQMDNRKDPPNIVFICSDEHNGKVMGWNGYPLVQTPNLDRLAARGVSFNNAYCLSPVCVPSRAGLMTGMFPSDVASYCNSTPFDGRVPTWGNRLRDRGYHCWATGKLDLVAGNDYGFQEVRTSHEHSGSPDITSLFRRPLCYRVDKRYQIKGEFKKRTRGDTETLEQALKFLSQDLSGGKKPWAMYVGLLLPH